MEPLALALTLLLQGAAPAPNARYLALREKLLAPKALEAYAQSIAGCDLKDPRGASTT